MYENGQKFDMVSYLRIYHSLADWLDEWVQPFFNPAVSYMVYARNFHSSNRRAYVYVRQLGWAGENLSTKAWLRWRREDKPDDLSERYFNGNYPWVYGWFSFNLDARGNPIEQYRNGWTSWEGWDYLAMLPDDSVFETSTGDMITRRHEYHPGIPESNMIDRNEYDPAGDKWMTRKYLEASGNANYAGLLHALSLGQTAKPLIAIPAMPLRFYSGQL